MKINISLKNEVKFYPDIENNLSLQENERFTVVFKKVNRALHLHEWQTRNEQGEVVYDVKKQILAYFIRFENPIYLSINGKERKMTIDDILDDDLTELHDLCEQIMIKIGDLANEEDSEKKS